MQYFLIFCVNICNFDIYHLLDQNNEHQFLINLMGDFLQIESVLVCKDQSQSNFLFFLVNFIILNFNFISLDHYKLNLELNLNQFKYLYCKYHFYLFYFTLLSNLFYLYYFNYPLNSFYYLIKLINILLKLRKY